MWGDTFLVMRAGKGCVECGRGLCHSQWTAARESAEERRVSWATEQLQVITIITAWQHSYSALDSIQSLTKWKFFQREREHRTKPKIRRVFAVCGWNKAKKAVSVTDSNSDGIIEWRFTKYVWASWQSLQQWTVTSMETYDESTTN